MRGNHGVARHLKAQPVCHISLYENSAHGFESLYEPNMFLFGINALPFALSPRQVLNYRLLTNCPERTKGLKGSDLGFHGV